MKTVSKVGRFDWKKGNKNMKTLRIGVIGLGDICHAYLSNLQKYPDVVELYACACRTPAKAKAKKEQYGFRKAYATGQELLQDPEVDLVLNLTTPAAHYSYNIAALRAGKHVYSEKPSRCNICGRTGDHENGTGKGALRGMCARYLYGGPSADLPQADG